VALSYKVLPVDAAAFRIWARQMHRQSDTRFGDAMMSATARLHRLTVVTRNAADFKPFGVPLLNPFEA
jgi:predicted nucleic acid-binding protein